MQKIVFFDIDGTLLNTSRKIPESTYNSIKRLKENKIHVAVATGRTPVELEGIIEQLGIDSFISCNGSYCVHRGELIFEQPLETRVMDSLINLAQEKGHSVVFQTESDIKALSHSEHLRNTLTEISIEIPEVAEYFYKEKSIYQILLFSEETFDETYKSKISELKFIRFHDLGSDVLPSGMSKAKGIEQMTKRLGFKMENVYAFGDGLNDIEMLKKVGHGVAMGNAKDELKAVADFVTKHVDEDGIEYALEKLGLI